MSGSSARSTARRTPTTTRPTSRASRHVTSDEVRHGLHDDHSAARSVRPAAAGRPTPITKIQTLGANAACNGTTVTVRGIVTGIDDLYGSNFANVFKARLGHLGAEADARPAGDDVERAVRRRHRPPGREPRPPYIGRDITISGRVETKFGLVADRARRRRQHQQPGRAAGGRSTASRRPTRPEQPAPRPGRARRDRGRGPGRDHPPVLPQPAGHARPAAGRHRDRRRHDEVPRRVRRAGHRTPAPVPQERPGGDRHAVVGRARRARHLARRRRRQPGRPAR